MNETGPRRGPIEYHFPLLTRAARVVLYNYTDTGTSMAERKVKRVSRGRRLTRREAARFETIREQVEAEKPQIDARIRSRLATLETVRQIGLELKEMRQTQGKSLADIRQLTGMDRAAISKLERGDRENPSMDTLVRYAQALGKKIVVSIEEEPG